MNLAVTALLALFLLDDLHERELAARAAARDREAQVHAWLEQVLDGTLSVDLHADERNVAEAVRLLRLHPLRALVRDGVVWQEAREMQADGVFAWDALFLNVKGAKHRPATWDEARAKRRMAEALRTGRIVRETDPALEGWVAAPIRTAARGGSSRGEAPLWGAGYFLLDRFPEPALPPAFQPSTLLLGFGAGTVALLALTWFLLERSVLQPLAELAAGAARVAGRRYDAPVPGAGGDEIGKVVASFNQMMAQVRDADRRLTDEVAEATRRAEERGRGLVIAQRLAATGTLASGIAHEINNPLGGMLNAALKLKAEADADPAAAPRARYLKLLVEGLGRIQEVVKRVIHFTPRRVEPQAVAILEVVQRAIAFADHGARKAGVTIAADGVDARVLVEPGEMQQVFLNLLLNAVDAIASARPSGRITITSSLVDDDVEVSVADDGPGMTPEQQQRCFDLFFTTKEAGKGSGIGLSVVHHIVEQHGGRVTVRSAPGRGTTFTVRLPRARA